MEKKNELDFEALTSMEKEYLASKLKCDIRGVKEMGMWCWDDEFCGWLFSQFDLNTKGTSGVFFEAVEYLSNKKFHPKMFSDRAITGIARTYYDAIKENIEFPLDDSVDTDALASAVLMYLRIDCEFFEDEVYRKLCLSYKEDKNREFIVRRLPFVIYNRDAFIAAFDLFKEFKKWMNGNKEEMKDDLWPDALIHGGSDCAFELTASEKRKLLDDASKVDFNEVPLDFYDDRK